MNEWTKILTIIFSMLLLTAVVCLCSVVYGAESVVKYENAKPVVASPRAPNAQGSYGADLCAMGSSSALSTSIIGYSQGNQYVDEVCRAIRLSKQMASLGLKVGAVSLLCISNKQVVIALYMAGSPCPVTVFGETLVGKRASDYWSKMDWVVNHYAKLADKPKYRSRTNGQSIDKSELSKWGL